MAAIDPDCRDGKHAACIGAAWDEMGDHIVDCECNCHAKREIERHDHD